MSLKSAQANVAAEAAVIVLWVPSTLLRKNRLAAVLLDVGSPIANVPFTVWSALSVTVPNPPVVLVPNVRLLKVFAPVILWLTAPLLPKVKLL
jgi:hypothetical protein